MRSWSLYFASSVIFVLDWYTVDFCVLYFVSACFLFFLCHLLFWMDYVLIMMFVFICTNYNILWFSNILVTSLHFGTMISWQSRWQKIVFWKLSKNRKALWRIYVSNAENSPKKEVLSIIKCSICFFGSV